MESVELPNIYSIIWRLKIRGYSIQTSPPQVIEQGEIHYWIDALRDGNSYRIGWIILNFQKGFINLSVHSLSENLKETFERNKVELPKTLPTIEEVLSLVKEFIPEPDENAKILQEYFSVRNKYTQESFCRMKGMSIRKLQYMLNKDRKEKEKLAS